MTPLPGEMGISVWNNVGPKTGSIEALVRLMKEQADAPTVERNGLEKIRHSYRQLIRDDKPVFFTRLQEVLEVRPEEVIDLMAEALATHATPEKWRENLVKLRTALESPCWRLLRRFAGLPGGLKFLLDLRADLLAQRRNVSGLEALDHNLVQLFESWFQNGFLFLQEISLDSPYRQIEIIKNGDMVHPMTRLEEMGQRLGQDRRCFALYHRAMPEEPVVFIEVALTRGMVRSIHDILGPSSQTPSDDSKKDTAIFYSINNTQNGLAGLGLGQVLIFQVVDFLKQTSPAINNFCTLSPMPGFWRRYLKPLLEGQAQGLKMDMAGLEKLFDVKTRSLLTKEYTKHGGPPEAPLATIMLEVFANSSWADNENLTHHLAKPLTRLGYQYLATEKDASGQPLDPVANFHLNNGATLSPGNVNFGANWSAMGLERSLSLMANYVYSQSWRRQISASMSWLGGFLQKTPTRPRPSET